MGGKKISKGVLKELIKRAELINQYRLISQALDLQRMFWLNGQLEKLGFDMKKQYEVDYQSGKIKEITEKPMGVQGKSLDITDKYNKSKDEPESIKRKP